jgi:type VI secretion system protein VasG
VVLLDEVEKAHRDVMNLFYQVFDRGFMRDGEGREIDFRNTVILMTSNLGSDHLMQLLDEQPEASEAIFTSCCARSCAITSSPRCWPASRP